MRGVVPEDMSPGSLAGPDIDGEILDFERDAIIG